MGYILSVIDRKTGECCKVDNDSANSGLLNLLSGGLYGRYTIQNDYDEELFKEFFNNPSGICCLNKLKLSKATKLLRQHIYSFLKKNLTKICKESGNFSLHKSYDDALNEFCIQMDDLYFVCDIFCKEFPKRNLILVCKSLD